MANLKRGASRICWECGAKNEETFTTYWQSYGYDIIAETLELLPSTVRRNNNIVDTYRTKWTDNDHKYVIAYNTNRDSGKRREVYKVLADQVLEQINYVNE